jgi:hypothetical protein
VSETRHIGLKAIRGRVAARRRSIAIGVGAVACAAALLVSPAGATAARPKHRHLPPHRGGRVHRAWPSKGARGRPRQPLARWLARQVGPVKVKRRARHRRPARRRPARRRLAVLTGLDPRGTAALASIPFEITGSTQKLALVRSYQIPADDPSATRLANLSWTYDSAVAAVALTETANLVEAAQLLDQLAALQRTDGSIDFAFNTQDGESIPVFRSGTIAWVGLAAADYRAHTCSSRYDAVMLGAARWLLGRQVTDAASPAVGLLGGGPDVSWVSTQHNLIARAFFRSFANLIDGVAPSLETSASAAAPGATATAGLSTPASGCAGGVSGLSATSATELSRSLHTAVAQIDAGLDRSLFVTVSPTAAYFREGVNDDVRPLDTQALGMLWLRAHGRLADAGAVAGYSDGAMLMTGRSIARSSDPATYNETYQSAGPFTGYRPYAGVSSPNVLWMEGTLEIRFSRALLGLVVSTLDTSIARWEALTAPAGPLQTDATVTGHIYNEYHVWPAAAAGAWALLDQSALSLLG